MAASWKGRALALSAPLVLAVALAAAVSGRGCGEGDDGPEEAVRLFIDAAADVDRARMLELVGPKTRAQLEAAAGEATDRSSRRFGPEEMLAVDTWLDRFDRDSDFVSVLEASDTRAIVLLSDRRGAKHQLTLVRVEGRWLIELVP